MFQHFFKCCFKLLQNFYRISSKFTEFLQSFPEVIRKFPYILSKILSKLFKISGDYFNFFVGLEKFKFFFFSKLPQNYSGKNFTKILRNFKQFFVIVVRSYRYLQEIFGEIPQKFWRNSTEVLRYVRKNFGNTLITIFSKNRLFKIWKPRDIFRAFIAFFFRECANFNTIFFSFSGMARMRKYIH